MKLNCSKKGRLSFPCSFYHRLYVVPELRGFKSFLMVNTHILLGNLLDDSTNISKNSDPGKVSVMVSFIIDYVTVFTIKCLWHYCIHEFLETFRGNTKLNET